MNTGVFSAATKSTLDLLSDHNRSQRCNFLLGNNTVSPEAAALGYVLDRQLRRHGGVDSPHRTFFVNSGIEATGAAIKLCRHWSVRNKLNNQGGILFIDPFDEMRPFFDPTSQGFVMALVPGLRFVNSISAAAEWLRPQSTTNWAGIVVPHRLLRQNPEFAALVDGTRRSSGTLLVDSHLGQELDTESFGTDSGVDVHVFGEELTGRQLPFGCLTMTERAHAVWNNAEDSAAHTSTFGGAAVVLRCAVAHMGSHSFITSADRQVLGAIEHVPAERLRAFHEYVNPPVARYGFATGMAIDVRSASGGRLVLGDGREILDCSGGIGSNLRGHNPADVPEVLARYDPGVSHYEAFATLMSELSGFPHILPAVSGATAVDLAVSFAMLAQQGRRTIVAFKGSYSGKTPISLNLSRFSTLLPESDRDAFRPYYANLVYIDVDDPACLEQLRSVLTRSDIALVWLELIQGNTCEVLDPDLIKIVIDAKRQSGYLIGVDEVFTGGWRTDGNFVAHAPFREHVDVASMAKPLSDMTIPLGAALLSAQVYERACERDNVVATKLATHYRCDLSALIATNALRVTSEPGRIRNIHRLQALLVDRLRAIARRSRVLEDLSGDGGLVRFTLRHRWFPFDKGSALGHALEMAVASILLSRCEIYLPLLRFAHRIDAEESEIVEITERLDQALSRLHVREVYFTAARSLTKYAFAGRFLGAPPSTGFQPDLGHFRLVFGLPIG